MPRRKQIQINDEDGQPLQPEEKECTTCNKKKKSKKPKSIIEAAKIAYLTKMRLTGGFNRLDIINEEEVLNR